MSSLTFCTTAASVRVGPHEFEELERRLLSIPTAAGAILEQVARAKREDGRVSVTGDDAAVLMDVLNFWLNDVGIVEFGERLLALRDALDRELRP